MTFMLAMLLTLAVPMFHITRAFLKGADGPRDEALPIRLYIIPAFGSWVVAMGFMVALITFDTWRPGHVTNYVPYLIAAGGTVLLIASAVLAFRGRTAPNGSWIVCALAGIHLTYSGLDHVAFYWDKENIGVLASDLAAEAGVQCAASHLVVKKEGNAFRYRCPTLIRLGNTFEEPFIPWPAYQEGTSEKLVTVVAVLQARVNKEMAERQRNGK